MANSLYTWGVMDGLRVFNDVIRENIGQNLFCVREQDEALSVAALIEEIEKEIDFARRRVVDFEQYATQTTVGEVAIIVLSRTYNCAEEG
jgi:hypothetical protein